MTPDELAAARTTPPALTPEDSPVTTTFGYLKHRADLTPGKGNGGGLHSNTFNINRKREGSAEFFPLDDELDPVNYAPVRMNDEECERRRAREWEAETERIIQVFEDVALLVEWATPHVKQLWHEKGPLAIAALSGIKAALTAPEALKATAMQPVVVEPTVVDSGRELAVADEVGRTDMSSAEARARYLAALTARAFSDEQMKLVSNANIVDGASLAELQRTLAELSPQQVKGIIEAVEANPSVLRGDMLAELGKLRRLDRVEHEAVPIEERREQ